jgi:hypothetical protein
MPRRQLIHHLTPIERFPTKARADGRFQKRIRNQLFYFGQNGDREAALHEYEQVKHDLYAGRRPRAAVDAADLSIKALAYKYLDDRLAEANAGRLSLGWYRQHKRALKRFVTFIGESRAITDLRPDDFAKYGRHLSQRLGDHAFNRERSSIVAMFRKASDSDWIDRLPKFGPGFKKIAASVIREKRQDRMVDREALRVLLDRAKPQLKAMLLLALNGGY